MTSLTIKYDSINIHRAAFSIPAGAVKLQFGSQEQETKFEDINADAIDLSLTLQPDADDHESTNNWLQTLIQKPLVISILEVKLTPAKKGKGPDTVTSTLVAQAVIDLMEFVVNGKTSLKTTARLHSFNGDGKTPGSGKCDRSQEELGQECEICVSFESTKSLIGESCGEKWNVMQFRVLNGFVPEESLSKDDFMVFSSIQSNKFSFSNNDCEVGDVGNNTYRLKWNKESANIEVDSVSDKKPIDSSQHLVEKEPRFGDFTGSIGKRDLSNFEQNMHKIVWAMEKRVLLTSSQIDTFETSVAGGKLLKLILGAKTPEDGAASGKAGAKAPAKTSGGGPSGGKVCLKSVGSVNADLKGLLYPGCAQIFGNYRLVLQKCHENGRNG